MDAGIGKLCIRPCSQASQWIQDLSFSSSSIVTPLPITVPSLTILRITSRLAWPSRICNHWRAEKAPRKDLGLDLLLPVTTWSFVRSGLGFLVICWETGSESEESGPDSSGGGTDDEGKALFFRELPLGTLRKADWETWLSRSVRKSRISSRRYRPVRQSTVAVAMTRRCLFRSLDSGSLSSMNARLCENSARPDNPKFSLNN